MCLDVFNKLSVTSDVANLDIDLFKKYIFEAILFLKDNFDTQINDLCLDIIVTEEYKSTIDKYYYTDYNPSLYENACTLNRFIISGSHPKDVVIVNWTMCNKLTHELIVSIIVHELVHHIDFQQIDLINNSFNVSIFSQDDKDEKEFNKTLRFFFLARTEMRAFYYDEIYLCKNELFTDNINQVPVIGDSYRELSFILPRLIGKIKCWEELNLHYDKIKEAKQYINTTSKSGLDWSVNFKNAFDFKDFYSLCKQIENYKAN